ncbi:MAG TPA: ABC transporter permease [Candidatus Solibacter sp.]|nr:ABC transporter permease [Candidatus Solibacter sp.]
MAALAQDLRYALRQLRKNPGFAAVAVLTLALGIGCALTMFSTYEGAILNHPPVRDLHRLANVWGVNYQTGADRVYLTVPDFLKLRSNMTAFEELAAFARTDHVLSGVGEPRRVETMTVSTNFFHLLGAHPKFGRVFTENDTQSGTSTVAVVSEGLWRRDFAEKVDILGRIVRFDGTPYTIIGVMPDSFWYPTQGTEVWMPLAVDPTTNYAADAVMVFGRLRKEGTVEQANAEAAVLARTLTAQTSATGSLGMRVVSYDSEQNKRIGLVLAFGIGPPILVLLIGCSNITNLLLSRGLSRRMEFATRAALGAGRRRIVRQLLTEYMVLAFAGASGGMLVAYVGVKALRRVFESRVPTADAIHLNWHTLVLATASALLIPVLFGLSPALRASKANLNEALRQGGAASGARITLKRLPLVVFEIAMAMLLLVVCGLFIRTLLGIERNAPPKIDATNLVTFNVSVQNGQDRNRLLTELAALPGITAVGATSDLPLIVAGRSERPLELDDNATHKQVSAIQMDVNAGFFGVLQLPALQGRLPLQDESSFAVVSETFAGQYGRNVVGMRVRQGENSLFQIVGVVRDWLVDAKNGQSLPTVYFPLSTSAKTLDIVTWAQSGASVIPSLKHAVHAWNPEEPVANYKTIAQALDDEFAEPRLVMYVFEVFALIALVLALIGQYGVMHHSTARRIHEMGVRIAVGATRRDIFALVLGEAAIVMVVGIALGWLVGIGAGRIVSHELVVTPADPLTAIVCASVMLLTGFAATYFPARRAAKVDPMVALRYE